MKRPKEHVLEDESVRALKAILPSEWILRDLKPDYGLDKELTIVEEGDVTNKVVWLQLKATQKLRQGQKTIALSLETKYLKFWETSRLPVIIIYWIKAKNEFYYLFMQRYIRETLTQENLGWGEQKTVSVKFPLETKLKDAEGLRAIATVGYFYVVEQQLTREAGSGPHYWLDGIPKSDNRELQEYTLKAILFTFEENHRAAIEQLEKALKVCAVGATEKMSLLLNLGNAYYHLSQNKEALKNYQAMLELAKKVSKRDALEGKASALGNIGLIYKDKGDLDQALKYLEDALKIDKEIGFRQGEAIALGNIGLIYRSKGGLDQALKYLEDALKIDKEIGFREGEANQLGNMGLIYQDKGDLDQAFKYLEEALGIDKEIGFREGEATHLGNIGVICKDIGDLDRAFKYFEDALNIAKEIDFRRGEASSLDNIADLYYVKGDVDKALKYYNEALKIFEEIGMQPQVEQTLRNIRNVEEEKKRSGK